MVETLSIYRNDEQATLRNDEQASLTVENDG
jgi:hypothetical protein